MLTLAWHMLIVGYRVIPATVYWTLLPDNGRTEGALDLPLNVEMLIAEPVEGTPVTPAVYPDALSA